ncbi:hypothetical protein [Stutzerimonas degradans]|nr:hypothetical protein [Stutzerimonas degradans]MCQ4274661.1 hypothetical protein [Stutzerimonas degradans]QPT19940.1 hypothetical protein I6G33_09600 [Stutzerimonas degradans]
MKISDFVVFLKAEAFVLSAIPAAAIAVTFIFEMGYLSFYGAPLAAIEVDAYKVIISCVCLIVLFYSIIEIFSILLGLAGKFNKIVGAFFVSLIPGVLISLFAVLSKIYFLFWIAAGVVVLFYIFVIIELRRERSTDENLPKSEEHVLAGKIKEFLFFAFIVAGLSFSVGYNIAMEKIKYFVADENRVLVEIYGDKVILAYFKIQNKERALTGEIELASLSDSQLKGRSQRLGPLLPAKTTTP